MLGSPEKKATTPTRILGREDAERLVAGVLATMGDLEKVLTHETAHVRVGRIRDGLAEEAKKSELATAYMRGLETVKANAIALARFAPDALDKLKAAHAGFGRAVETNQTVLATALAVSESLMKGVADEMRRGSRAQAYGPAAPRSSDSSKAEPLVVSRLL